jgi:hypothetical protein
VAGLALPASNPGTVTHRNPFWRSFSNCDQSGEPPFSSSWTNQKWLKENLKFPPIRRVLYLDQSQVASLLVRPIKIVVSRRGAVCSTNRNAPCQSSDNDWFMPVLLPVLHCALGPPIRIHVRKVLFFSDFPSSTFFIPSIFLDRILLLRMQPLLSLTA